MLMLRRTVKDQEDRKEQLVPSELKSSISLWFERWFLSTNAKDIGTCATRAFICVLFAIWSADLDITGAVVDFNPAYLP